MSASSIPSGSKLGTCACGGIGGITGGGCVGSTAKSLPSPQAMSVKAMAQIEKGFINLAVGFNFIFLPYC
jgi:hypothetical protein